MTAKPNKPTRITKTKLRVAAFAAIKTQIVEKGKLGLRDLLGLMAVAHQVPKKGGQLTASYRRGQAHADRKRNKSARHRAALRAKQRARDKKRA